MNLWKPDREGVAAYLRQLAGQIEDGTVEVRSVVAYGSRDGLVWRASVEDGPYFNLSLTGLLEFSPAPAPRVWIGDVELEGVISAEIEYGQEESK